MAKIREELILVDKFTGQFTRYTRLATQASGASNKASEAAISASRSVDRFAKSAKSSGSAISNLTGKLKSLFGAYLSFQGLKSLVSLSDQMTGTTARLNMIVDDGGSVDALERKIKESANRSRASYLATADAVAKMGLMAGDAFSTNNELIRFTETLNKQFAVAGTSTMGIEAATLQLTQAMASGVLRGEELNSVFENAPNVIQAIADYMDVPIGQIRKMASEGQITAEIVKNAMLNAADDVDEKFQQMPKTWAQVWKEAQNKAMEILQPLLDKISEMASSPEVQKAIDNVIDGLKGIADVATKAVDALVWLINTIDKFQVPLIIVAGAIGGYTFAVKLATIAQGAWNAALTANPIGIIIVLIAVLIAAMISLWDNCEGFRDFWVDMWSKQMNAMGGFYNNVIVPVGNAWIDWINTLAERTRDFCVTIVNLIADMSVGVLEHFRPITKGVEGILKAYNALAGLAGWNPIDIDAVFSPDTIEIARNRYISGINSTFDWYKTKIPQEHLKEINLEKYAEIVDAAGEKIKDFNISNWIKGLFEKATDAGTGGLAGLDAALEAMGGGSSSSPYDSTMSGIADDTSAIRKSVSMNEEDLKSLVEMAERQYVNNINLTSQAPVINVSGQNTGSTELDRQSLASTIRDVLLEQSASSSVRTTAWVV